MTYLCLTGVLAPIALINAGFSFYLTNMLYYCIAMLPLWHLLYTNARAIGDSLMGILSLNLKETLVHALASIKQSELLVLNGLTPSIVDLKSFDIEYLLNQLTEQQATLSTMINKLSLPKYREKILSVSLMKQKHKMLYKLIAQKKYLNVATQAFIDHLIENIGEEVLLLCASVSKNKLKVYFSKHKINAYYRFVSQFGTKGQLERLNANCNVGRKWLESCADFTALHRTKKENRLNTPWGGYEIRTDYLNGWQTLLDTFCINKEQKEAFKKLNLLISNTLTMSADELMRCLKIIDKTQNRVWLRKIQDILYLSLQEREPQVAFLLSPIHKMKCKKWYQQHQREIIAAEMFINTSFSLSGKSINSPIDKINNAIQLLKAANVCRYSLGDFAAIKDLQHRIIKTLKNYEGCVVWPYRLILLLPLDLQNHYRETIAQKRINWLMKHSSSQSQFTSLDVELFYCQGELKKNTNYFSDLVKAHPLFENASSPNTLLFLKQCRKAGFDDGSLLKIYQIHRAANHESNAYVKNHL